MEKLPYLKTEFPVAIFPWLLWDPATTTAGSSGPAFLINALDGILSYDKKSGRVFI